MKQHITLLIICLFICGLTYSQSDTSYVIGDTVIEKYYYKNGQLEHLNKYVKGRDIYSFHYSFWYYKNGNPQGLSYWDYVLDTSFYFSGRKNGSIKFRDINNKYYFERIKQNSKSELIERTVSFYKDTFLTKEIYKHGHLISSTKLIKKSSKFSGGVDTVTYYQGQVGGNSIVVTNNNSNEFVVNGVKLSESEYNSYIEKYDKYFQSRGSLHFYREFTSDSILVYEGIFKGDLHCGTFREYFPNGVVKVRGEYNDKGEKIRWWTYYNEQGLFYKKELYEKGNLKK